MVASPVTGTEPIVAQILGNQYSFFDVYAEIINLEMINFYRPDDYFSTTVKCVGFRTSEVG